MDYPHDTFAKLSAPFKHIKIEKGDNGTLQVRTPSLFFLGNAPKISLIPIEPLLFQRANDEVTGFGEDSNGQIAFAFNPIFPVIGTYERIYWYETVWVQLGIVGFCAVVFLSVAIIYLLVPLIRRWRGKRLQVKRRLNQAWLLAGTVLTLGLLIFTVLAWKNNYWSFWKRSHYSLITLGALVFIPFLTYWNLLGFQF